MEDILKILVENIEGSIVSSVLLFSIFFIVTFNKHIPRWIDMLLRGRKEKKLIDNLKDHDIFSTCARVKTEVHLMKFYTEGEYDATKTRMCGDFARHKVEVCSKRIEEFISDDLFKLNSDALKKLIFALQTAMHEEYVAKIKTDWLSKGVPSDDVDYVIVLFEKFRYDVIMSFENRINSIFGSTYHRDNFDRVLAVLEMWSMGIDLLPKDMLTTFETLNGKFKKIKYK
jgi:hypothetical protein